MHSGADANQKLSIIVHIMCDAKALGLFNAQWGSLPMTTLKPLTTTTVFRSVAFVDFFSCRLRSHAQIFQCHFVCCSCIFPAASDELYWPSIATSTQWISGLCGGEQGLYPVSPASPRTSFMYYLLKGFGSLPWIVDKKTTET